MQDLVNEFNMLFVDKITNIRTVVDKDNAEVEPYSGCEKRHSVPDSAVMNVFKPISETDIMKLVSSAPAKSCEKDPAPTTVLKNHLEAAQSTACFCSSE